MYGYVFRIDRFLSFGHEFFCKLREDGNVSGCIVLEHFNEGPLFFLPKIALEVFVDDLKALGVLICELLLSNKMNTKAVMYFLRPYT
jgi:hypothetical protein